MALTKDEEAKIELIVIKAVEAYRRETMPEITENIEDAIKTHIKTCPIGEEFRITKAKMMGVLVGIGMGSAAVGGSIATLINKIFP